MIEEVYLNISYNTGPKTQFQTCNDEFFLSMIQSGRSITTAPDKIFAQTFFEGIDKGWNGGLVGVSITSANRECPKNRKLTEKQWEQPDDFFTAYHF